MVVELSDKWELGVVVNNYHKPRLSGIKQTCTHGLPWSSGDLRGYHRLFLLRTSVLLAHATRVYETFYFSIDAGPANMGFGSYLAFFYAKICSMDLLRDVAS